jgi:hypothetical protein
LKNVADRIVKYRTDRDQLDQDYEHLKQELAKVIISSSKSTDHGVNDAMKILKEMDQWYKDYQAVRSKNFKAEVQALGKESASLLVDALDKMDPELAIEVKIGKASADTFLVLGKIAENRKEASIQSDNIEQDLRALNSLIPKDRAYRQNQSAPVGGGPPSLPVQSPSAVPSIPPWLPLIDGPITPVSPLNLGPTTATEQQPDGGSTTTVVQPSDGGATIIPAQPPDGGPTTPVVQSPSGDATTAADAGRTTLIPVPDTTQNTGNQTANNSTATESDPLARALNQISEDNGGQGNPYQALIPERPNDSSGGSVGQLSPAAPASDSNLSEVSPTSQPDGGPQAATGAPSAESTPSNWWGCVGDAALCDQYRDLGDRAFDSSNPDPAQGQAEADAAKSQFYQDNPFLTVPLPGQSQSIQQIAAQYAPSDEIDEAVQRGYLGGAAPTLASGITGPGPDGSGGALPAQGADLPQSSAASSAPVASQSGGIGDINASAGGLPQVMPTTLDLPPFDAVATSSASTPTNRDGNGTDSSSPLNNTCSSGPCTLEQWQQQPSVLASMPNYVCPSGPCTLDQWLSVANQPASDNWSRWQQIFQSLGAFAAQPQTDSLALQLQQAQKYVQAWLNSLRRAQAMMFQALQAAANSPACQVIWPPGADSFDNNDPAHSGHYANVAECNRLWSGYRGYNNSYMSSSPPSLANPGVGSNSSLGSPNQNSVSNGSSTTTNARAKTSHLGSGEAVTGPPVSTRSSSPSAPRKAFGPVTTSVAKAAPSAARNAPGGIDLSGPQTYKTNPQLDDDVDKLIQKAEPVEPKPKKE